MYAPLYSIYSPGIPQLQDSLIPASLRTCCSASYTTFPHIGTLYALAGTSSGIPCPPLQNGTKPRQISQYLAIIQKYPHSPKSSLDTPDVVFPPISPRHLLLPHWHSIPLDFHNRHPIHRVLLEVDLQNTVMSLWPLLQPPILHNLLGFLQLQEFARNIAAKELELTPHLGAGKALGRRAGECCKAVGGREGLVELAGRGTELFGGGE